MVEQEQNIGQKMWIRITGFLSAVIGVLFVVLRITSNKNKKLKEQNEVNEKLNEVRKKQDVFIESLDDIEAKKISDAIENAEQSNLNADFFNKL